MTREIPRLRMFAGPNGSGKSSMKLHLPPALLGYYLNPDEIQIQLTKSGSISFRDYGISITIEEIVSHFEQSLLMRQSGQSSFSTKFQLANDQLIVDGLQVNAYVASVLVDLMRKKYLLSRTSFSFETVMSHPDKVSLLEEARSLGYRTYLYYIATEDPEINIARVAARVGLGGHDVPRNKIFERYQRSLDLLVPAIKHTDRAYLFDNSQDGSDRVWVAEITNGKDLTVKCDPVPRWFQKAVWNKLGENLPKSR